MSNEKPSGWRTDPQELALLNGEPQPGARVEVWLNAIGTVVLFGNVVQTTVKAVRVRLTTGTEAWYPRADVRPMRPPPST